MKNNKGVTLTSLVITIVILIILSAVTVFTTIPFVTKIKINKMLTNMEIIQVKVDEIYENYQFDKNELIGERVNETFIEFSNEEIEIIENSINTNFENLEWYKWNVDILNKNGVDSSFINSDEFIYVNYEYSQIVYSKGIKYENKMYYSLEGLNSIF